MKKILLSVFLVLQAGPDVRAQEDVLGVVWRMPDSAEHGIIDLQDMRAAGIKAVRTGPITDSSLLVAADSFGIVLYRELPLYEYSASRLVDSTAYASSILRDLIQIGRNHTSAGPIGLAVRADVSDEAACVYFDGVTAGSGARSDQKFYYVGSFADDDACSESVDFVLLDVLDVENPLQRLGKFREKRDTPVGLASIGSWVDPTAKYGLNIPHSEERQARRLERSLSALDGKRGGTVAFVHRWRDFYNRPDIDAKGSRDVYGRHYGLHDAAGRRRPSMQVLEGFLGGGQTVFAFGSSESEEKSFPLLILFGWMLILTVGILYASSPRFRYMAPRYFFAHGFFRNAVRDAREVLPIISTALLTTVGLSVGILGSLVLTTVSDTEPVLHVARILSPSVHFAMTSILSRPFLPIVLLGSISLLAMSVWMGIWMMVTSRRAPLLPSQALMLAVWPRWQLLVLLPVAMSLNTLEPALALKWLTLLVPAWLGTAMWSTVRTAFDLLKVSRCSVLSAVIVWMINPINMLLAVILAYGINYSDEILYLWHLASRS